MNREDVDDTIVVDRALAAPASTTGAPSVADDADTIVVAPSRRGIGLGDADGAEDGASALERGLIDGGDSDTAGTAGVPIRRARIRIEPDGAPVELHETVYIGRRPAPPRVQRGLVRLVSVPSPRGEISATHVEIKQLGVAVVATDLGSTNGTIVLVPGQPARRLRAGESATVSAGCLIDLGEGVVVRVLTPAPLG